jgi:hypothetical protein
MQRGPRIVLAAMAGAALGFASPQMALACACGCSIFDVGTQTLLPSERGGTLFLEYDALTQNQNWHGNSRAPATANDDKRIHSDFFLAGAQYMFDENWGAMIELPYTRRSLRTTESGTAETFEHESIGDVRVMGMYSGFSPDMSLGAIFGVKLPTGDHNFAHFDTDVQIGSGSTDLLLGGYKTGALSSDGNWSYFAQVLWQHEIATQDHYRPGSELNGAAGIAYADLKVGDVGIAPVFQFVFSHRGRDGAATGDPDNTGYDRLLASPGVALVMQQWKFYADIELPLWQQVNGNQLVSPLAVKLILSRSL